MKSNDTSRILHSPHDLTEQKVQVANEIKRCCKISEIDYQIQRVEVAKSLGVSVTFFDKLVKLKREEQSAPDEGDVSFSLQLMPSEEPACGVAVYREMVSLIRAYMHLSDSRMAAIIALWCLYTHAIGAFRIAPKLLITAPSRSCGKSTLVEIVAALSCRCESMVGVSPAIIYRLIEKYSPTMAFDEVDNLRNSPNFDEITAIMNAGHKRGSYVWRCTGDSHEPKQFKVFAPQIIAMIGKPKSTTTSRSIVVQLSRANMSESNMLSDITDIDPMSDWLPLRRRALRWGLDNVEALKMSPEKPSGIFGREWNNWRPLLRVAEVLGDYELIRMVHSMCIEASGYARTGGVEALTWATARKALDSFVRANPNETNIRSKDLYQYVMISDNTLKHRYRDITALSRFVGQYKPPGTVRVKFDSSPAKGWKIQDLLDHADRYAPDESNNLSDTPLQSNTSKDFEQTSTVTSAQFVTDGDPSKPNENNGCNRVTEEYGDGGEI